MENTPGPVNPTDQQPPNKACANCGNPQIVEGFNTLLCHNCRQAFIKYPIPLWIKLFAGGIGLIVLFSLYTFPKDISTGLHYERGLKAEKAKKYVTAEAEYKKVLAKVPEDKEAMAHLILVSFYGMDFQTFGQTSKKMVGKGMDDDDYMKKLNILIDRFSEYYSPDAWDTIAKKYTDGIPDSVFEKYLKETPGDLSTAYDYANNLYQEKSYQECDSLSSFILWQDSEYQPALLLKCAAKRELGDWDSAIICCNRILAINREAAYAIAAKARVLLKEKKDNEALKAALESVDVNKNDTYCKATLALAYHYNNQFDKRDALVKEATQSNDPIAIGNMQTVSDYISGKVKFR